MSDKQDKPGSDRACVYRKDEKTVTMPRWLYDQMKADCDRLRELEPLTWEDR